MKDESNVKCYVWGSLVIISDRSRLARVCELSGMLMTVSPRDLQRALRSKRHG